jgi:hypothetical protein
MKNQCPECGHEFEVKDMSGGKTLTELVALIDRAKLTDYEKEWMETFDPRLEKYGDDTRLTERQVAVLRKMSSR